MPSRKVWADYVEEAGGRVIGGCVPEEMAARFDYLDAGFYPGKEKSESQMKYARDKIARAMRIDGWIVKTEKNTLGYFFEAKREISGRSEIIK